MYLSMDLTRWFGRGSTESRLDRRWRVDGNVNNHEQTEGWKLRKVKGDDPKVEVRGVGVVCVCVGFDPDGI